MAKERSFWSSIPGVLTGLAGLFTGVVGLLGLALGQGWLGDGPAEEVQGGSADETDEVVRISTEPDEVNLTKLPTRRAEETVTVSNDGTQSVTLSTDVDGENEAAFDADDGDCTRSEIPPQESCDVSVSFDAGLRPSPYQARLLVSANGGQDLQEVRLEGRSGEVLGDNLLG